MKRIPNLERVLVASSERSPQDGAAYRVAADSAEEFTIDEATAIVVTGGTAEVIGKSKVAFFDYSTKPEGEKDFAEVKAGEKYDLKARKKLEK